MKKNKWTHYPTHPYLLGRSPPRRMREHLKNERVRERVFENVTVSVPKIFLSHRLLAQVVRISKLSSVNKHALSLSLSLSHTHTHTLHCLSPNFVFVVSLSLSLSSSLSLSLSHTYPQTISLSLFLLLLQSQYLALSHFFHFLLV